MQIKILYEDGNMVAIDKPSGLAVHGDGKTTEETLVDWILKKYPKMKSVGEPIISNGVEIAKPGIVHRLDRETSGVLVLAKNQKTYEFLKNEFKGRTIKKIYIAIVDGWVKNDKGIINRPIGRSPRDFRRRLAGRGARGEMREAVTEYKVLRHFKAKTYQNFYPRGSRFEPKAPKEGRRGKNFGMSEHAPFTLLEIKPKTGRTHQIRVHMKFLNHPVACDELYNPGKPCPAGFSRLALHAKSIEFTDMKGKKLLIESPLPKEFKKVIL